MKKVRTLINVLIPYYFEEAYKIARIIFYEIVIVLVIFGVLYVSNYKITVQPNVQIVSPLVEAK